MATLRRADLVAVMEASYRTEASDENWLRGVMEAARPALDSGQGLCGYAYNAADATRFRMSPLIEVGIGDERFRPLALSLIGAMQPEYILGTYRKITCAALSESLITPALRAAVIGAFAPIGVQDLLVVNALDPGGRGVYLGALRAHPAPPSRRARATWGRIAAHIAAGHRLRRALARQSASDRLGGVEAVCRPGGGIEHATGPATDRGAREALRQAVLDFDQARGARRQDEPEQAVEQWKGLVAARWTLLDHFETGGGRFVVARCNPAPAAPVTPLSARERQAVGYACLGHSNKLIAYELGIAASTVSVLLHRAAGKLGVASRAALIEAYAAGAEDAEE